jgi:hypothetical protein
MRRFRISLVAVAAVALAAATAASALPSKTVLFTGSYAGQASTKVTGNVADILASGKGSGAPIGAGKITGTGTGDSSQQPCVPFAGTGTLSGPGGVLTFKVPTGANGCGDEGGHVFAIKGIFQVTKATGKQLAKAKGSLRFSGTYNHDDGSFSIKLTGSLTK